MMADKVEESFERYNPQHPLPDEIRKMEKDKTVCKYCGVSYLIHSEIKNLENRLKSLEKELERYKGLEDREAELQKEVEALQNQRGEYEMTITVKEAAIATLSNNLKNQEDISSRLKREKEDILDRLTDADKSCEQYREKVNRYERGLPGIKFSLHQQKSALQDIHAFMEARDQAMKEEMDLLLSHIRTSCEREIKAQEKLTEEKNALNTKLREIESKYKDSSNVSSEMKKKFEEKEEHIKNLENVQYENRHLQKKCSELEGSIEKLKRELEESIAATRGLTLECKQFKDQLKIKAQEMEELTANFRKKEQNLDMASQKVQGELRRKEAELVAAQKELKSLQYQFQEQQEQEESVSQKISRTINETKDLKELLTRTNEEIAALKEERDAMISSHQTRIEQLRESFKEKISDAEKWPQRLEDALRQERDRHIGDLRSLEQRLKESFIMELEIEKQKYQEMLRKYQSGSKTSEDMLKAHMMSMESKYKAEIDDLQTLLAENKTRAKEMEAALRREIENLKSLIRDLENRLARIDYENEELVNKLRSQLQETHHDLEGTRNTLEMKDRELLGAKQEIGVLQETVRKECEERMELTEALGEVKEELLQMKKPLGGEWMPQGGYSVKKPSVGTRSPRTLSPARLPNNNKHLPELRESGAKSVMKDEIPHRSSSVPSSSQSPRPSTSSGSRNKAFSAPQKEYTVTKNNNLTFPKDMGGPQEVGKPKATNTLAQNRRRIAAILGRK
ncbi:hypothetical protein ACJMK2_008126 [Sinanodonta woodiana]|uniref:Leucine-, glutamate- and lysine-rich protein 1 n=1 Tax=Sinanodonta woodiana TaxID=1069815 RepID=A0ABD3VLU6_SINWO